MFGKTCVIIVFLGIYLSTFSNCKIRFKPKVPTALWTYQCDDGYCKKQVYVSGRQVSLESCSMLCGTPPLWPLPKNTIVKEKFASPFRVDNIRFSKLQDSYTLLNRAAKTFSFNVLHSGGKYNDTRTTSSLNVHFVCSNCEDSPLTLTTDESYSLETNNVEGNITATIMSSTFYGVRHGLETLSQLIWWDPVDGNYKILTDVTIHDKPQFPYRGLMIDVSRNFFTVKQLKKVINGMAASKLNALHLHVSDTQSFPLVFSSLPTLGIYGSYGPGMAYTELDINKLRLHAQSRGVRLILEIDAPGHVNVGWNSLVRDDEPNITTCDRNPMNEGQLNPDSPRALDVLETIYKNLIALNGQSEIFHIGGDEVNAECWRNTKAAAGYTDLKQLEIDYMNKMIERLKKANQDKYPDHIVLWNSDITNHYQIGGLGLFPAENIVIQYWLGRVQHILDAGHSVIYSPVSHWYLDCGFGPWNSKQYRGVCDPYKSWRDVYQHRPWEKNGHRDQTLGGEVCLWSELVDEDDLETRIWPRASALGERLWSDTPYLNKYVYVRLSRHRDLLKSRGLRVAAIWPKWCSQNPGMC